MRILSRKFLLGAIKIPDTTLERVKKVAAETLLVNADEISGNSSFSDDLGADSLDAVELAIGFEEEFNLEIPDEDAEKIRTVDDAVAYINQKLGEGSG